VISSSRTSWPTAKPATLDTCTEVVPRGASAVRLADPASATHTLAHQDEGIWRRDWSCEAGSPTAPPPQDHAVADGDRELPVHEEDSGGEADDLALRAGVDGASVPDVASIRPFPKVDASTVAQTVSRSGMPPRMPGFHTVRRSAAMISPAAGHAGAARLAVSMDRS